MCSDRDQLDICLKLENIRNIKMAKRRCTIIYERYWMSQRGDTVGSWELIIWFSRVRVNTSYREKQDFIIYPTLWTPVNFAALWFDMHQGWKDADGRRKNMVSDGDCKYLNLDQSYRSHRFDISNHAVTSSFRISLKRTFIQLYLLIF